MQLDVFVLCEYGYEFKVIVTDKTGHMKTVVPYHEGHGSQGIFAELKTNYHMDYVPVRRSELCVSPQGGMAEKRIRIAKLLTNRHIVSR